MTTLDLDFVRAQFPAFSEATLMGQAFFENAGGSYACGQVIDRLTTYYRQTKVQPYGPYAASREASELMDSARVRLAGLLNIAPDTLNFGPSTSQNTYVLAHAMGSIVKEGDEVIVTNQDHEANSGAWRRLAERGAKVREWQIDAETGALALDDLDALITERTRLVTMPHCSNIVGQFNDTVAAAAKAHAVGALLVVDGVSFAPHGLPDIPATGADIYLFSLYKTFGPHLGAMYISSDVVNRLDNQAHFFNADGPTKRLTPAGPDHAQIAAVNGIADYYDALYVHHFGTDDAPLAVRARKVNTLFAAHEQALTERLLAYLRARNDVRILGPQTAENRAATIAVQTRRPANEIAETLATKGIMAGSGDFYAVRLIEALGMPTAPGVLRLSFVHYTSEAEIDQLIAALDESL